MAKTHPESLDEINSIDLTEEIREFTMALSKNIEDERTDRSLWEDRVDRLRNLRYGIRKKKNFPWPGASNFSIPLIDADINRLKPAYFNLAYSVSPVVTFQPFGSEDIEAAKNKELLFDWRLRTKVKFFEQYALGIDRMLEQGSVVFKVIWKFSTRTYTESFDLDELDEEVLNALFDPRVDDERLFQIIQEELRVDLEHEENIDAINKAIKDFRDGKQNIDIDLVETVDNQPEVIACDLREDLIVPVDTIHLNDARWIDYLFPMTINQIKIAMQDGKFEEYDNFEIEGWAGKEPNSLRRGLALPNEVPDEQVWVHETCVWKDINGDGIEERCIVTWPDAAPGQVLRFIENPYDHGMWPYVHVKREFNDEGFYASRGISELDADFQKGISTFLNQAVDNGTITNTPQVVVRQNALVNKRNLRYVPGNVVETKGPPQEFQITQFQNTSQPAQLQLTQFLKNWSDQRSGSQTSGLTDSTNLPGQGQGGRKTKAEIELVQSLAVQNQSLDLHVFQQQMAFVYRQIDALYDQFGDDVEEVVITGKPPITVSRREIQGKFDIIPNGRLDNSTPQQRLQKAIVMKQALTGSPFVKIKELDEQIAKEIDDRLAGLVFMTDEEVQQAQLQQVQQLQAVEEARQREIEEQLQLKMAVDDTDIRKEALLVPISGKKFAPD